MAILHTFGMIKIIASRLKIVVELSDHLLSQQSMFLYTRSNDKTAVLLHLLRDVIQPNQLTVVFLATRHHVDYVREVRPRLL